MPGLLLASVRGGNQLRDVAKALRQAARDDLRREVDVAVRRAGKPTLVALQQSARKVSIIGIPRPGRKRRYTGPSTPKHLRDRMARATKVEIRASTSETRVSFVTDSSRMGSAAVLPRKIDSGKEWRHPVMGDRKVWAASKGTPWFFAPIRDGLKDFRAEIGIALDDVAAKIERS